ncbi:MAG TPA: prolyl oligopeptidase family serine peptidase [Gemmatimonadaceae bacterium]|jgi:dipeptidyl aminopeptidase/acylaminoacyl peptidase
MNIRRIVFNALRVLLLSAASIPLAAQSKKPITQDTYDLWRAIQGATLSPDGKFAMYTVSPVVGDGEVVIRGTGTGTEYRFARGYTGRPQLMPAADSAAIFVAPPAQFSAGSTVAAFITYAARADFESARKAKPRPLPPPRTSLTIVTLADGKAQVIPRVRSFRFAREGGRYLAYLMEADTAAPGSGGTAPAGGAGAPGGARAGATGGTRSDPAAPLMLRDLTTGQELKIDDVTSYLFDEGEKVLVYATTVATDSTKTGVYVRDLATGTVTTLAAGKGNYKSLAVDRKAAQVAFVTDRDDIASAKPRYALYHALLVLAKGQKGPVAATKVVDQAMVGAEQVIADRGRLDFVRDGTALQFALAPIPIDSIPADSLTDKAVYDLWHYRDTQVMPMQKVNAARERGRTWTALYTPAVRKWAKLGNDSLRQVTVSDNGKVVLALNAVEYAIEQTWGEGGSDAYLLDPTTAARTLVARKLDGAQLSPGGKYVTFFRDGKWFAHATASGKQVEITAAIKGVKLDNEEFDMPDTRPPYGLGGWTTDDARVLVYDRYDAWEVDPAGVAAPVNLTAGAGRAKKVTYRVVNLDSEDRFLDPAEPLMLRAFDNETKASGYARARLGASAAPEVLVMGPKNYAALQKARKAGQYLLTQQRYREFPDLWTGTALNAVTKISNANPQDAEYPRGDVELVSWLNDDGVPLKGMLFKPEGFDASKKYPMITYFYEKLADGLHTYYAPSGRNTVNPLVYNSLGYLVFMPDIVYTDGFPGPSAAKAIIPGVQSLIARGFVDSRKLGVTGQSWGGYQSAYLITVTNMFAAAVPNATVVNMTSAYDGIRWQSGLLRQMQYEHSQSRIGGSLWQYPERFIENSPLFKLDRVTTPVLFMANDNDGAVPWYQGIEFYGAMRRLQKEAYLVVYNGDEHNPTKRANQKDIDRKMQEFFGAKLLSQPEPDWMKNGIPFLKKGQDQLNRR